MQASLPPPDGHNPAAAEEAAEPAATAEETSESRQLPSHRTPHEPVARIMTINKLDTITPDAIEAAREVLVVGA